MSRNRELISIYGGLTNKVWQRMVDMVGVHTVIVLIQRAVWLTKEEYHEAENIRFNQQGIFYNELLEETGPERTKLIIEEFFGNIIGILTKLIGEKIAEEIKQDINQSLEVGRK